MTGCGSSTSSVMGAALASTAPSVSAPVPAARAVSAAPAPAVYLAEGGSVGGTVVHAPACKAGCQLSGDGTTSLWDMTWATWNSTAAVGAGTEKLDDCTPDCASGTLHAVPVRVTLRASFTWPSGLPGAFSGGNAPLNPFDYPDITAQAAKSCP
jgi:hypothetical protein